MQPAKHGALQASGSLCITWQHFVCISLIYAAELSSGLGHRHFWCRPKGQAHRKPTLQAVRQGRQAHSQAARLSNNLQARL